MLRFASYNIVFQEIPDEVTLAINITGCPNRCKACHSPHLMEDTGEILNSDVLSVLLDKYSHSITCVCFMGGDSDPETVERLSLYVKRITAKKIKTAWYSGKQQFPDTCSIDSFDYIKLGPYIEEYGGLDSLRTNQRFYIIMDGFVVDATSCFSKKERSPDYINNLKNYSENTRNFQLNTIL